jgi:hypothetical protein
MCHFSKTTINFGANEVVWTNIENVNGWLYKNGQCFVLSMNYISTMVLITCNVVK